MEDGSCHDAIADVRRELDVAMRTTVVTLIAGVDSSTQSCKVIIRTESGRVVRHGRAAHPSGTEVDPERWWEALMEAIMAAGGLDDVTAISIAGQQHGMVVLDAHGAVVRPALLWNDTRSAPAAAALISELGRTALAARTGSVPVASFTATKLRWMRDAEPEAAARVAAVALPHDWLTWRLLGFGEHRPDLDSLVTDRSEASGTSYWSPRTGAWDRELLVLALGHDAVLPAVLPPDGRAGVTDGSVPGIPAGIVVGAGAGDNAAAALGLGASAGDLVVSIGTSGTVFAVTEDSVADASGVVAGFASADGGFLPLVATLNAARVLDATAALLNVDHRELSRLALEAPPAADGLVLVPYFEGERTPNLPDATATLSGMTLATMRRPHLARAAIEGMLCGLADGVDAIRSLGVSAQRALLVGGAAQSSAVANIAAQVLDLSVEIPEPGEYVASGAAVQASWAQTGERPRWDVASRRLDHVEHVPQIRAAYHERADAAPHAALS